MSLIFFGAFITIVQISFALWVWGMIRENKRLEPMEIGCIKETVCDRC